MGTTRDLYQGARTGRAFWSPTRNARSVVVVVACFLLPACDDSNQAAIAESSDTTTMTTMLATVSASPLDPLPQETGRWSVDTPIGQWDWTLSDADFPSDMLGPIDGRYYLQGGEDSWQRSEDGVTWEEGPIPDLFVDAPFINDDWYARVVTEIWVQSSFEPGFIVYRRVDGTWRESDLRKIIPKIDGMRPTPPFSLLPATNGPTAAVLVLAYEGVDWEPLYGEYLETRWDPERGTVELVRDSEVVDELLAVALSTAVEFRDPDDGELVLRINLPPEVHSSHVLDGKVWLLLVDEGDGFRLTSPPWEAFTFDDADIVWGGGGFLLMVNNESLMPQRVPTDAGPFAWRSADGFNWDFLGSAGLPASIWADSLNGDGSRLFVSEPSGFGGSAPPSRLWTSLDGSQWQPLSGFGNDLYEVTKTSFGWMLPTIRTTRSDGEHVEVWVSEDGLDWASVPMTTRIGVGGFSLGWEGDLIFIGQGGLTTLGGPADP